MYIYTHIDVCICTDRRIYKGDCEAGGGEGEEGRGDESKSDDAAGQGLVSVGLRCVGEGVERTIPG